MTGWFEGKSILVTGAASGIGASAARRFAAEGASVCLADRDGEGARRVAGLIEAEGGRAISIAADIAVEDDNRAMVRAAVDAFGGLDNAFLNAGYFSPTPPFGEDGIDAFDRIIAINLRGTYLGLRSVFDAIRPGGAVVVTASAAGLRGLPDAPAYSASKHGLVGLVTSVAPAFSEKQCRINVICPGGVNTPMSGVPHSDAVVAPGDLRTVPCQGYLDAQHVAEMALFLASTRAGGLTGTAYAVDGGLTATLVSRPPD